jgi:hypothetical protein
MAFPHRLHDRLSGQQTDMKGKSSRYIGITPAPLNRSLCNLVMTKNPLGKIGGIVCFVDNAFGEVGGTTRFVWPARIRDDPLTLFDDMQRSRTVITTTLFAIGVLL